VNRLAPEHLELLIDHPETLKPQLKHYGALFMGHYSPVPVGDYMAGPNHTLPTAKTARFSGGLNPLTFLRPQSWIHVTAEGQDLLRDSRDFARLEGLHAHAMAAEMRTSIKR
jgi:histidinol dehydrogenase